MTCITQEQVTCLTEHTWGGSHFQRMETRYLMVIISGIPYVISSTGLLYFFKKEVEQTPRVPTPVIPDFLSFSIFFLFTRMKPKASSYGRVEHSKATPKDNGSFPESQVFIFSPWMSVITVLSQPKTSNGVSSFNNLMPPECRVPRLFAGTLQVFCWVNKGLFTQGGPH